MIDIAPVNVVQALSKALKLSPFNHRPQYIPDTHIATSEEKLLSITGKSHEVLHSSKTVFPFDLFPDSITIDREKLTITQNYFFYTAKILSVPINDILSIEANIGPFFGSIHISSRYIPNTYSVNFLRRGDAVKLQRLLQGYIIAFEQHIDCSEIEIDELINLLNSLGEGETT